MNLGLYPNAVSATDIIAVIAERKAAGEILKYGYECLYFGDRSTRPSMEFSIYAEDLSSPDWQTRVSQKIEGAVLGATGTEVVFYDPD